eukprot:3936710-Alexandrium_andersonii.AAC.1
MGHGPWAMGAIGYRAIGSARAGHWPMAHGPPWPAMAWRLAPGPSATHRRMGGAPRYPARGPLSLIHI